MEVDMCALKVSNNTFAVSLEDINVYSAMKMSNVSHQIQTLLVRQLHEYSDIIILSSGQKPALKETFKSKALTFKNIKSSARSATQSCTAVHFPMPPLPANLVQRASSAASIMKV